MTWQRFQAQGDSELSITVSVKRADHTRQLKARQPSTAGYLLRLGAQPEMGCWGLTGLQARGEQFAFLKNK